MTVFVEVGGPSLLALDPSGGTPAIDVFVYAVSPQGEVPATATRRLAVDLGRFRERLASAGVRVVLGLVLPAGDVPLTALLLVDASASMRGAPLSAALAGAEAFVRAMQPLDRAQLVLFADRVIHATPSTGFAEVLAAGLKGVEAEGGTALNDHLYLALRLVEVRQGRRVIVLLSDGVDVASVLGVADVDWAARRSQALVYWIRLGTPDPGERRFSAWRDAAEHRAELEGLEELVVRSGGRVVSLAAIDEAAAAFAGVLAELREQYVLGYYPTGDAGGGKWHGVKVRVTRPGLVVRAQEGYLDE